MIWESVDRLFDQARASCSLSRAGLAVLFEVNRTEAHIKPTKPFDGRMEDTSWAKYKRVFRKLFCYWVRSQ